MIDESDMSEVFYDLFLYEMCYYYYLIGKLSFGIISHFCSVALSIWKVEALTVDAKHCLFP